MRRIVRVALAANLWLTAAVTLVAGIPHFDCRCADGSIKPFSLSLFSRAVDCCRGVADRLPTSGQPAAEAQWFVCPCCQHQAQQTVAVPSSQARWEPLGCTKLLVRPTPFTAAEAKSPPVKPTSVPALYLIALVDRPALTTAGALHEVRCAPSLPPPGDRLHLLQRLTI